MDANIIIFNEPRCKVERANNASNAEKRHNVLPNWRVVPSIDEHGGNECQTREHQRGNADFSAKFDNCFLVNRKIRAE